MTQKPIIKNPIIRKTECCYCHEKFVKEELLFFIDKDSKPNCECFKCHSEIMLAFFGDSKKREYYNYLEKLRKSGDTNMFGAVAYLLKEFPELSKEEALEILVTWINSQIE
jgi:hypothetical protein